MNNSKKNKAARSLSFLPRLKIGTRLSITRKSSRRLREALGRGTFTGANEPEYTIDFGPGWPAEH